MTSTNHERTETIMAKRALCPECGKPMRYERSMRAWDCGPEAEGGHGYWDTEIDGERVAFEMVEVPS